MTQPEASSPPNKANPYARVLLVLSILLMVGGIFYIAVSLLALPHGLDVIQTNEELPLYFVGNGLGWNTLGLGVFAFCLWLAVQGIRHR